MSSRARSLAYGKAQVLAGLAAVCLLLAVGCTTATQHAAARSARNQTQSLYVWPRGKPVTYNDIMCGGAVCSPPFAGAVPPALRRPLHLPALVNGQCPVPPARIVAPGYAAAEGPGPIYPIIAPIRGPGILAFSYPPPLDSITAASGFGGQKVFWLGAPSYRGPVLIRGVELGGDHLVGFDMGTQIVFPELQFPPAGGSPNPDGWRGWPSGTALKAPGCYAWQIDGTNFSYTVVFKAVVTSAA